MTTHTSVGTEPQSCDYCGDYFVPLAHGWEAEGLEEAKGEWEESDES